MTNEGKTRITIQGQNASTHATNAQSRATKRILSVTIKRMLDDSPDTSYMGEYASRPSSDLYSIDRAHDIDCAINTHVIPSESFPETHNIDMAYARETEGTCADCGATPDECLQSPCQYGEPLCTCGNSRWNSHELRYFNPSFNYVRKDGTPEDGLTPDDVRKYVRQDYERMERLNQGDWSYMGLRAEAEVQLTSHGPIQEISSGGLWGIESDSDRSYFAEVEQEELSELRKQLEALGFSKRAVTAAFRNVEHKDE